MNDHVVFILRFVACTWENRDRWPKTAEKAQFPEFAFKKNASLLFNSLHIICHERALFFTIFSFQIYFHQKILVPCLLCLEILILLSIQLIHNNVSWMLEFCRMAVENCLESLALCAEFQLRAPQRKPLLKLIVFIVFLVLLSFVLCFFTWATSSTPGKSQIDRFD